jgi:oxygen-dependent protoporphyrinogen oxidase
MPARAPDGYTLLRVFFGGGEPTTATMAEDDLVAVVRAELRDLLGIAAEPVGYRLARWPGSYAQADVGHLALVDAIEQALPAGLYVTGASYRGLAVPDCIRQGRATARQALATLSAVSPQHQGRSN